jgi:hypothetical protein
VLVVLVSLSEYRAELVQVLLMVGLADEEVFQLADRVVLALAP